MTHKSLYITLIGLILLVGTDTFSASLIPAWTRGLTPASWKALTSQTIFRASHKAPFIKFPRRFINPTKIVKSTDKKFIYHHVNYSGVFDKAEKKILLTHVYPQATLGKITYLHDKHAAFYSIIITKDPATVSETAFMRHQEILNQILIGLEANYLQSIREQFASDIFSVEEIARLQIQEQPPSYLLTTQELHHFAQLPTLSEQKEWVSRMLLAMENYVHKLLAKDTFSLKPAEFDNYYRQNARIRYFRDLSMVLDLATKKRPSAIIRYRQPLPIPGGENILLTDAQRAGYLQFMADTNHNPAFAKYIEQFNIEYGNYAVAEALEVPYEVPLLLYMQAPELLGAEEGARLRQLAPTSCLAELTPKIIELDAQLTSLRRHPSSTPEFYASYYRVYAKQQIYKTLVARARAMIELENFRR